MVGNEMGGDLIGYTVGGAGILFAVAQMAWSRFFGEAGVRAELYQQLGDRVKAQEERMASIEVQLDTERRARMDAEWRVQMLDFYVRQLKAELLRHGIEIPPSQLDERPSPESPVNG